MSVYGFVGASKGLSGAQFHAVATAMSRHPGDSFVASRGGFASEMLGYLAYGRSIAVDWVREDLPEQLQHAAVVEACNILIACPSGPESPKSPTWTAVRHARQQRRAVVVIAPDGTTTKERPC